jgi:hypothetical protein
VRLRCFHPASHPPGYTSELCIFKGNPPGLGISGETIVSSGEVADEAKERKVVKKKHQSTVGVTLSQLHLIQLYEVQLHLILDRILMLYISTNYSSTGTG